MKTTNAVSPDTGQRGESVFNHTFSFCPSTGGEAGEGFALFDGFFMLKTFLRAHRRLAAPAFSLTLFALTATAQTVQTLPEMVVSATRTPTLPVALTSDVTVLNRVDIEKLAGRTLAEVLARVPGLQMSSNGGLGKTSGVSIRGTESRHTLLLVDGVRYGSATVGTPVWDSIPVDLIERIEILKGPASALYGSEAIGGVVQIFMRKGSSVPAPYAAASIGSRGFAQLGAGVAGSAGEGQALSYVLDVQRLKESGFSATNIRINNAFSSNFNPDGDGFGQSSLNAALGLQINPDWKFDSRVLLTDGVNRSDDGLGRDTRYRLKARVASLGLNGEVTPGWRSQIRASQSLDTSDAIAAGPFAFPGRFNTRQNQITWQNEVATPLGTALLGAERLTQSIDSTVAYTVNQRSIASVFAGINGNAGSHSWQANIRRDSNSQFGSSTTGVVGYGLAIAPAWRLNASYGSSFAAPSFNQLYFPNFGNALLLPEKGRNTEIGMAWSQNGQNLKLTRFDNRIRGFIANTTLASNIPRARIQGTSLSYGGVWSNGFALRASVDSLDARNELTGRRLPRRAQSLARVEADYAPGGDWSVGGSVLRSGSRFDDTANTVPVAGFTAADVYATYTLSKDWSLQAKINNLANAQYETIRGYNQPGRNFLMTLRWQPK